MVDRRAEEKYTDPALRARLKRQLERSAKGGRPGQWSARKSQLLVKEYERRGGGYRGPKDRYARSLERWTAQDWQTQHRSRRARDRGGMARYLPREAWRRLSPAERREAEESKRRADRRGASRVSWPPAVKRVMRELDQEAARSTKKALYDRARALDIRGRSRMTKDELYHAVAAAEGTSSSRRGRGRGELRPAAGVARRGRP